MSKDRLQYLVGRFDNNEISQEEFRELFALVKESENEGDFKNILFDNLQQQQREQIDKQKLDLMLQKILKSEDNVIGMVPERSGIKWWRIAVAAMFFLAIAGGAYFWVNHTPQKDIAKVNVENQVSHDVAPGGNKAILTLDNETEVILDSAQNGAIAQQGNAKIIKLDSGRLVYNRETSEVNREIEVSYNTISTPRGGQYQVTLSDGTKVWLNAASSLRYPTVFVGKERNVYLSGEAYFEVAKNASMPFHVNVKEMRVEVLGTHFNVMAYNDESAVKTTLLEGSVKVIKGAKDALLNPGQQAQLYSDGEIKLVANTDIDQTIAWKNGQFYFKNNDITEIMKQLARWYNVEIIIKEQISNHYTGIISRYENISNVLNKLELTGGVHFEINGNKVIVTSK